MSHDSIHEWLFQYATYIKLYVKMRQKKMSLSDCDIHPWVDVTLWLPSKLMLMKVRLWPSSKLISNLNIHKSWCYIATSSKLAWHCDIHECWCQIVVYIEVYVTMRHTTMSLSHCDINESWCCIVTFIKVDVEISQCDIHQIRCWIVTSIKGYLTL